MSASQTDGLPVLNHGDPNPAWLARLTEDILEPDRPIIDPHHHLWDRPGSRYFLDELLADLGTGHNVAATVFLQCGWAYRTDGPEEMRPVGETEFVASVAADSARRNSRTKVCAGIVGYADMMLGESVDAVLEAHTQAACGRFRGIRHGTARDKAFLASILGPPPFGLMPQPAFHAGVSRLAAHGLTFDAWLYHTQIGELTALARACPIVPMVLDHVGGPLGVGPYRGRRDEVFAAWRDAMRELATCPNVHVKLGGLAMMVNGFDFHEQALPPSSGELAAAWRPFMEDLHRDVRTGTLHVREQFSGGQGNVQLSRPVERLQANRRWRVRVRKIRTVPRHRRPVLSSDLTPWPDTMTRGPKSAAERGNMNKMTRRGALGVLAAATLARPALIHAQTNSTPVRIGLLSDVGGPYQHIGGPGSKVAAEMAAADFGGSVLGRPIEVLQADDQNKADVAGSLAREWIDDRGMNVLADGAASTSSLAIQQITREKKRIFLMSTPTSTAFIGKQCSPYGFQFACDTYALAKGTGTELVRAGGDTWFFLTADYEFGYSLQRDTEQFVKQAGGKILGSARAPLGTADFSSLLLQAKASGAKVIGLANAGTDLQNCIKQAAEFGIAKCGPALGDPADDHPGRALARSGHLQGLGADQLLLLGPLAGDAGLDRAL